MVGGILIHPAIKASYGLLGTTFGGNHLACIASLTVLETIEKESLMENVFEIYSYFLQQSSSIQKHAKVKGRGLMLGLEFDFPVKELRSNLIYKHHIFTGSSKNPNLLRILPPLTLKKEHIDDLFDAIKSELS